MKASRKRVAILGGTGFAGRSVRDALEAAGMSIGMFSRTSGCDLLDLPTAWAALDSFRPDFIVNCAAVVGSINYVTDFAADVVDTNMRMLLNLYKIAEHIREVVIVNPIANCAYPGVMDTYEEDRFWDGAMHPSVLSYGSTRRMMAVLASCYKTQYGVRSANLVVPNMYGPYDSTSPNKTHALNALVIKFVRAVKFHESTVEIWGTGRPIREWLFVRDFAKVIRNVIESEKEIPDLLNIGQNSGYSVTDLVNTIREMVGYKGEIEYNTRFGDGAPKKVMGNANFRDRFPDFEFTPLQQGLLETVAYYKKIL